MVTFSRIIVGAQFGVRQKIAVDDLALGSDQRFFGDLLFHFSNSSALAVASLQHRLTINEGRLDDWIFVFASDPPATGRLFSQTRWCHIRHQSAPPGLDWR